MNEKRNRALKFIEMVLDDMWMEGRMLKSVVPNEDGDYMYMAPGNTQAVQDPPFETHDQYLKRISKLN
jgi:hypothetical protein